MRDFANIAADLHPEDAQPRNFLSIASDLGNESAGEIPGQSKPEPKEERKPGFIERQYVAPLETAATVASGMVAAPISAVAGIYKNLTSGKFGTQEGLQIARQRQQEVQDSLTYQPRSESGKEAVSTIGKVMDESKLAGLGPTEAISLGGVMAGPGRIAKAATRAEEVPQTAKFGSVGAASSPAAGQLRATVANASPELQAILEKHLEKTPRITQEALERNLPVMERHVEADSLPVKIHLTPGQATQDVSRLSREQNMRGAKEVLAKRFNEQNTQLIENTEAIRQQAAPDIYATTKPEHGEILIDAYKAKDTKINADISAKYQALKDANGGQFPLDSKAFVESADAALHKQLLYDQVPAGLRSTLDRLKTQGMTFENFESLRTNLARIQRSQADGNVKHAAGIIRNALEDLPMPPGAENLKPLADAARAAARDRFALIEKDPAYKAVVNGKASADSFIDKHVIGADTKAVQALKDSLTDDPTAQQAVASGVVNHLKQRAGITDNAGNFSQAGYNKAVESIRPKLGVIFQPEQRQQLETLGRVARYTQAQPRGSFVNNSNTLVGALAEGAKSTAEGAANVAFKGVPVGTWTRKMLSKRAEAKALNEMLQTGGGIQLKDIAK